MHSAAVWPGALAVAGIGPSATASNATVTTDELRWRGERSGRGPRRPEGEPPPLGATLVALVGRVGDSALAPASHAQIRLPDGRSSCAGELLASAGDLF